MSVSRPRWEWRSFGRRFPEAEARLDRDGPEDVRDSDEVYLIARGGGNVKIRDGLIDVKILQQVNADGLEQWLPILKAPFPLSAADAAKVLHALHLPAPDALRAAYSLDAFLADFAGPESGVRVVPVHKRRRRYGVAGCMAETADILVWGTSVRTVAVEAEDASAVLEAVAGLGLGGYANVSYPRALLALVEGVPERFAVIDVGTNSVKFHLAERDSQGAWRTVADRAEVTRLGEGLAETGAISDVARDRTASAIAAMRDEARRHEVRAIAAVGTAGLRIAANADAVVAAIRARTGLQVEVISGEDEARLAYLASVSALPAAAGSRVVFDTGGGSSQFTFGHGTAIDERFSLDVGAARYTGRFGLDRAVSEDVLRAAMEAISAGLARLDGRPVPDFLVGMGGAVTNLAAVRHGLVRYDPAIIQGAVLDAAEIDRQIETYRSREAEARRMVTGLQPQRAEVILAGACIVRAVMAKLGRTDLTVSDRGLRHGVLADRFGF